MKHYIVWNEGLTEGVIFANEQDAIETQTRCFNGVAVTALGDYFANDCYDSDELTLQEIELPTPL